MKKIPLFFPFFLSFLWLLFGTIFLPHLRVLVFAPFFAFLFLRKPLLYSMWVSSLCGLLIDLLSSETKFGLFFICTLLTTVCIHRFKHYFYDEKLISIPCYTALFSFVFTLFHTLWLPSHFSFLNFLILPMIDATYAFFWFACPLLLYNGIMKLRGKLA